MVSRVRCPHCQHDFAYDAEGAEDADLPCPNCSRLFPQLRLGLTQLWIDTEEDLAEIHCETCGALVAVTTDTLKVDATCGIDCPECDAGMKFVVRDLLYIDEDEEQEVVAGRAPGLPRGLREVMAQLDEDDDDDVYEVEVEEEDEYEEIRDSIDPLLIEVQYTTKRTHWASLVLLIAGATVLLSALVVLNPPFSGDDFAPVASTGNIYGEVLDRDGNRLEGIRVELVDEDDANYGFQDITDEEGRFRFDDVDSNRIYLVTAYGSESDYNDYVIRLNKLNRTYTFTLSTGGTQTENRVDEPLLEQVASDRSFFYYQLLLGLAILVFAYLLFRASRTSIDCKNCGEEVDPGFTHCPYCDHPIKGGDKIGQVRIGRHYRLGLLVSLLCIISFAFAYCGLVFGLISLVMLIWARRNGEFLRKGEDLSVQGDIGDDLPPAERRTTVLE